MNTNTIDCPKCNTKIEINKVLTAQLEERIREELQADVDAQRAAVAKETEALAKQKAAVAKAVAEAEQKVRSGIEAGLAEAKSALTAEARKKAKEDLAVELQEKAERVGELETKLKAAQTTELALRKRERELQEKQETLDLEVAKRIKAETDSAREAAKKQAAEEHELKTKESQEQISGLRKQIDELKRKAEQGSQQTQGEALELILEDVLGRAFPLDGIQPIAKGVNGADILQRVVEPSGMECGGILWETKNAKKWNPAWLTKLRDDQRNAKAVIAVLVTEVMPPGQTRLDHIDGVWVCDRLTAVGLGLALRAGLVELAKSRQAADGKAGKIERVYDYLTSAEFRQRVSGMVEPLVQLQDGLNKERRAMERIWSAREKQIQSAIQCMHGMYGDLQGIVGYNLPTLAGMELPALPGEDEISESF
jgi:hypothetical protein